MRNKKTTFNLAIFIVLFCFFSLFPFQKAQAAMWPAVDPIIRTMMANIMDMIKGVAMGAAKQAAVRALNQEINFAISGSSGGTKFVVDWRGYLFENPEKEASKYLNDYLSQVTSGRGSASSYQPNNNLSYLFGQNFEGVGPGAFDYGMARSNPQYTGMVKAARAQGFSLSSNPGNYIQQLVESAKRATIDSPTVKVTYVGHPDQMFAKGNFENLNRYISPYDINSFWLFNLNARQEFAKKKAELEKIASDKVIAGEGFPGEEKDGRTIMPGSLIKESVAKVQNMGVDVIANSQHIPEVLTAIVSQMITKSIQQGIGNVQAQVRQEVTNVRSQARTQINAAVGQKGPGALYQR